MSFIRPTTLLLAGLVLAPVDSGSEEDPGAAPQAESKAIQPPRMAGASGDIGGCYSRYARRSGQMGRVLVSVTIAADGSVSGIELPSGIESWQGETARCVVQMLRFKPALKDGVAVAAQAKVPINFSLDGTGEVTYLHVAADADEFESALRACYPSDTLAIATPEYRVTVDAKGRVSRTELVTSSGDRQLDEAGACMINRLAFQPTKQGGRSLESSAIVPVTLRPPK